MCEMKIKYETDKLGYYHIPKKLFFSYLRVARKFFKTGDTDYLDAFRGLESEMEANMPQKDMRILLDMVKAYINFGEHYTDNEVDNLRLISLASFCGVKLDD